MRDDALENCHIALSQLIGSSMEPMSVIRRAEEHRAYWRPAKPRVVLLAESHVYTSGAELQRTVRSSATLPEDLPRGFVRLVYCLGYGENGSLDVPIISPRNAGTPQYWKLFYSCINRVSRHDDCASVQSSRTPNTRERLQNKVRLLDQLRAHGIWLVDASIAALYVPASPKPMPALRSAVLQTSWDLYTGEVVADASPEAIVCIGIEVGDVLKARINRLGVPWVAVPQPNARGLSTDAQIEILATCHAVCEDPRVIGRASLLSN